MKKIPFWCPHCKRTIEKIDYKYIERYGACGDCFINYIENKYEDETEDNVSEIIRKIIKDKNSNN
jgi:hypothetical protein